jgi:signal transduction histidine kinase
MPDDRFLSSEDFTLRDSLFWSCSAFYALGCLGGLVADGFPQWSFPVFLDWYSLAILAGALAALRLPRWKKSHAAATLLYGGASTFVMSFAYELMVARIAPDVAAYNNLFVLAMFLGPAVFLSGPAAAIVFAVAVLGILGTTALVVPRSLAAQHFWFEVPGIVGVSFLLYRYRYALDRVLANLQRAIHENKVLRERERLASLGELTAGISHEIKNPLNLVINFAESSALLLDDLEGASPEDREELLRDLRQNLADIQEQGQRGVSIVQSMLLHARSGSPAFEVLDVNRVVLDSLNLAGLSQRDKEKKLRVRPRFVPAPAPALVMGSRGDLSRAFLNLCSNALWSVTAKARRSGPGYVPMVTVDVSTKGGDVWIQVTDNGLGFDARVRNQLFVPFFTTKSPGEGTGLGLSLTREVIVDQHNGRLEAEGDPKWGAVFTVVLPGTRLQG